MLCVVDKEEEKSHEPSEIDPQMRPTTTNEDCPVEQDSHSHGSSSCPSRAYDLDARANNFHQNFHVFRAKQYTGHPPSPLFGLLPSESIACPRSSSRLWVRRKTNPEEISK